MNDKIINIRRRTMNSLEETEKMALKNRWCFFVMNQENLNPEASEELEQCKSIFEDLATAHYLKEALGTIYRNAGSRYLADVTFEWWYELATESKTHEMKTMAKTIKKHNRGILAYWQTAITSASMEGFNKKTGWLTRQAYAYKDEEYLILKIHNLPQMELNK